MNFEKWLASIIKEKSINLSEMVRQTGLCYPSIYASLYDKKGSRELRSSELIAICKCIDVNPMDFAAKEEGEKMKNFDALKQMPLKSFASMVFDVARRECQTEEEFVAFLEKEVPAELEETTKEALHKMQCSSLD